MGKEIEYLAGKFLKGFTSTALIVLWHVLVEHFFPVHIGNYAYYQYRQHNKAYFTFALILLHQPC